MRFEALGWDNDDVLDRNREACLREVSISGVSLTKLNADVFIEVAGLNIV